MKPKLLLVSRPDRSSGGRGACRASPPASAAPGRARRQAHVAVIEHRRWHSAAPRRAPPPRPAGRAPAITASLISIDSSDLEGVKARARRHVEIEVGVVHPVQSPQQRDGMEHHVLQIDGEVERQHRGDDGPSPGQGDMLSRPMRARRRIRRRRSRPPAGTHAAERCSGRRALGCSPSAAIWACARRAAVPGPPTRPSPQRCRQRRRAGPAPRWSAARHPCHDRSRPGQAFE